MRVSSSKNIKIVMVEELFCQHVPDFLPLLCSFIDRHTEYFCKNVKTNILN